MCKTNLHKVYRAIALGLVRCGQGSINRAGAGSSPASLPVNPNRCGLGVLSPPHIYWNQGEIDGNHRPRKNRI